MNQQHDAGQGWNRPQADHSPMPGAQAYGQHPGPYVQHQGAHNQPVQPYNQQPGDYGSPHGYGPPGQNAYGAPAGAWSPGPKVAKPVAGWIVVAGAVLAAIGCFLPWVTIFGTSVTGMTSIDGEFSDGVIFLPVAVVVAVLGVVIGLGKGRLWLAMLALLGALFVAGFALVDFLDIQEAVSGAGALASVGAGLPVIIAGGVIAVVGSVMAMVMRRSA